MSHRELLPSSCSKHSRNVPKQIESSNAFFLLKTCKCYNIINRARYATNDKHRSKMCLADLWEKVKKGRNGKKTKNGEIFQAMIFHKIYFYYLWLHYHIHYGIPCWTRVLNGYNTWNTIVLNREIAYTVPSKQLNLWKWLWALVKLCNHVGFLWIYCDL